MVAISSSCNRDIESNLSSNLPVSNRSTTTAGSFSTILDGILSFPSIADFHQTADYIATDTTLGQLNTFRGLFSINTLNKKADHVLDSLESALNYPSRVSTYWPDYLRYIDTTIVHGDTIMVPKFGEWGEFLNLHNLVIIDGYLYKITKDKTIIITDGDRDKLEDAEEMEESDTANNIFIISPRACACNPTGVETQYEQTKSYGNVRSINRLTYSNLTVTQFLPMNKVRVFPAWSITTKITIQKKGVFGWHLERKTIAFNRQVNFTHNYQTIPAGPNVWPDGSWNESTGWNPYEADFNYKTTYKNFNSYITDRTGYQPMGYCIAVRIFAQTGNVTDPTITNSFYFYPFPLGDFSGYWDLDRCPNFDWLYFL